MTLEELFETHIGAVRMLAVKVEPHGDIASMLGTWRDGKLISAACIDVPDEREERQRMHERMMEILALMQADAYTLAMAAWVSPKLSRQELAAHLSAGMGVADRADRQEVIVAIAGNREETLSADLEIVRSPNGRISHLKRRERQPGVVTMGLFHDLLLRPPRDQLT
jgi:hypothetical protein